MPSAVTLQSFFPLCKNIYLNIEFTHLTFSSFGVSYKCRLQKCTGWQRGWATYITECGLRIHFFLKLKLMRKNMLFRTFSVLLAVALFAAISPAASDLKATRLVSKWTNDGRGRSYAYINNSGNLSGDGTEIIFYDWNDDGIIDHTAICVGTGYPLDGPRYYSDLIDQHTTNRKQVTWHLDYFNQNRNSTAIYAFGL